MREGFDVDCFYLPPGRLQRRLGLDDQFIWVDISEGRTYGVCRVVRVEKRRVAGGKEQFFYWVEYDAGRSTTNSRFIARAKAVGLKRLSVKSNRQIRNDDEAQKLRAYFEGL